MAEREATPTPDESSVPAAHDGPCEPDVLPLPQADPSDDSPTVITKKPTSADALNDTLRGRTLAHFELLEPIGVGGMAAVIRARDKLLERIVALKILPPETAADPENVRRFQNEARAAARLDHENIARVFYCGEDQGLHFIAFEFVEGINLRALLQRRDRLPVAEAVHYMLQIATGLAHAAARGVVHRDIKPSNIIISPNGRAKLVDMGLARHRERRDDQALTQSGVTLGTFDYISPEQALEPRDADARSDIYSLGCTFYHMLTGHAPVPEGTAAKKVHHHQHVAPVDPRQLNPEIPDDIAAILARMMAKDPKDRYQRPEHLVQHLILVAQKVGAPAEVPGEVLFVDAPLPTAPARRPLLMVGLAALGLAAMLVVLSLGMSPSGPVIVPKLDIEVRADAPPQTAAPARPRTARGPAPADHKWHVKDEKGLHEAINGAPHDAVVLVQGPVSLSKPGPVFRGRSGQTLRVESADPENPAVIRLAYHRTADEGDVCAAVVVDGGQVLFRNIRFDIEADHTPEDVQVAAVVVRSAAHAVFERCTFVQKAPVQQLIRQRESLVPVASVAVMHPDAPEDHLPHVTLRECFFQEGQDAVAVEGSGEIRCTNCALGKHNALFHLRPAPLTLPSSHDAGGRREGEEGRPAARAGPAELQLAQCSAFVVRGPVFRLDGDATCHLTIKDSIFSCPDEGGSLGKHDQPHLFRQTGAATPAVRYEGERNCFHNLNALWVLPAADAFDGLADDIIVDWPAFVAKVDQAGGRDRQSRVLDAKVNPWHTPNPLRIEDPALAFQVNPALRELRETDLRKPLGVWRCAWGPVYPEGLRELTPPQREDALVLGKKQKVVDPSIPMSKDQIYPTLTGALEDARPGDEILIKEGSKSRVVEVAPLRLRPDLSITLKPYPDQHPLLTLAANTDEEDAALFHLNSGQLKFEQIEFALRPDRQGFKSLAVIAMKGNAQCAFRQCLFTLADEAAVGGVHLSVVALLDPKDSMKGMARDPRPAADIQLENCLVRGEGDCLRVRAGRPFELGLENCIAALTGSLVNVEGNGTEPAAPSSARIRLDRVTTYLTDHLVQLRAGRNGKGLVPTAVSAVNCLFAAAGGKAFVFLDGVEGERQMKELFSWEGRHNAYDGFDRLLDQQPPGEAMVMLRYDQEKWRIFANESDPQPLFLRARCFDFDHPLAQVTPEDFRPRGDMRLQLLTYGSTLTRDSMPHAGEAAPEDADSEP